MSDQNPTVSELFASEKWSCATYASLHTDAGVQSRFHAPSRSWEAAEPDTGSVSDAEFSVDDRNFGREATLLAQRQQVHQRARTRHPERWSRDTRDWTPAGPVRLNPSPEVQELKHIG
ncbi:hypothetical protein HPP05_35675 [Corallococcus exiguus]|uniref:hypothetical protein n=1 Tax=Corallococcus exiguus TaxID=83462 RepID=UPI0014945A42|nr:hypothetical protein [Corallococcus exiguus]NPC75103.1 hypothetical protein [Corallococcus exiguus]